MPRFELSDGRTVPVIDGLTLGRVGACDVVLDDEKVSRKHARVVLQAGVAEVEDLGSRNGLFLNGNRVLRRVLRDGDVLTVGRTELRYVEDAPVPAAPTGFAPGEDLLADEPASTASPDAAVPDAGTPPARTSDPVVRPRPAAARPIEPPRAAARDDVEVLEFVDEIVEVRKPSRPDSSRSGTRPTGAPTPTDRRGVLQFNQRSRSGGALGEDVGQLGGLRRGLVVLAGLAAAAGAAWLALQLVA